MDYRDPEWVAERLGLERNTVYRFLHEGTIPAVQLGRKWLISESRLERWLAEEAERQTQVRREAVSSTERTLRRMDNFTPRARQVIRTAHTEARRLGHDYLGQEHLLLGFVADAECVASRALKALDVDGERLRKMVEERISPGQGPAPRRLARTAAAKKAMRLAMREAKRAGRKWVGSEHLLLGIVLAAEGPGSELLKAAGVTAESVRGELENLGQGVGAKRKGDSSDGG